MTLKFQGQLVAKIKIQRKKHTFSLKIIKKQPIMFNNCFDSGFNCHQCSVSNERMVVMTADAILLLQTDLNIRTIAHSRPICSMNVFKNYGSCIFLDVLSK